MQDELDTRIRQAFREVSLPDPPAPSASLTGLGSMPEGRRLGWRRLLSPPRRLAISLPAVACVLIAGGVAIGFAAAPQKTVAAGTPTGPGFEPGGGWNALSTGVVQPPYEPSAIAATTAFSASDTTVGAAGEPWGTLAALPADGIVITADFVPRGESAAVDAQHPPLTTPLTLSQLQSVGPAEGEPRATQLSRYVVTGSIGNWDVDVNVYFGSTNPTTDMQNQANAELGRLVAPSP